LKRVVITGLGGITPLGNNFDDTWKQLLLGKSGADKIKLFDTKHCTTKIACEVKNFVATDFLDKKDVNKLDLVSQYALVAAKEALDKSALLDSSLDRNRIGVIWATGNGGASTYDNTLKEYHLNTSKKLSPYFVPKILLEYPSNMV
jgi:3-oxoacyl-[acyl-carrier-protein] synthase II